MQDSDRDRIIKACELGTELYAVPPLGSRINFHSQQIRALNLLKALHLRGEGAFQESKTSTIAVIGAGLSGITTAVGLASKGHTVHIYDVFTRPLTRQASASHRMLHPTVNYWPDGKHKLSASTCLPFFDWAQDQCDVIVGNMQEQWRQHCSAYKGNLVEHFGVEVDAVVPAGVGGHRLRLKDHGNSQAVYGAVFVTVGFSEETVDENFKTPSYWEPDTLDRDADDPKKLNRVISGAGDGGLIEALRCLYRFKKGLLAFQVAEALEGTAVEHLISEAEKIMARPGASPQDVSLAIKKYDEAIAKLTSASICDAALESNGLEAKTDCKPESCSCKLAAALKMIRNSVHARAYVTLFDRSIRSLVQARAAPVHKLLVMLAQFEGRLVFRTGTLSKGDKASGTIASFTKDNVAEVEKESIGPEAVIYLRHGAKTCFGRILKRDEREVFGEGHAWMSEFNVAPLFTDKDFQDPQTKVVPSSIQTRAKLRRVLAESALARFATTPGARVVQIANDSKKKKTVKYIYAGPKVDFGISSGVLFGVPIEYEGPMESGSKSVPKSRQE